MSADSTLLKRQLELEDESVGLALARATRIVSGERLQEEVEVFGGDKSDREEKKKRSLLYAMAFEDLQQLAAAIADKRKNHGTKVDKFYTILEECGNDVEIAGVVIKAFFDTICNANSPDDEEEDEDSPSNGDTGSSMPTIAQGIAEALHSLYTERRKSVKTRNRGKRKGKAAKTEAKPWFKSPQEEMQFGLNLAVLYAQNTNYYQAASSDSGDRLGLTAATVDEVMENVIADNGIDTNVALDKDVPNRLAKRNITPPAWTPTLLQPVPWSSMTNGGYHGRLSGRVSFIKNRRKLEGFSQKSCPEVFEALGHIQETSFKINKYVFSAFSTLYRDYTERLHSFFHNQPFGLPADMKRFEVLFDMPQSILKKPYDNDDNRDMASKLWMPHFHLHNEAERFLNEKFYFVNYCDFRGRVYPKASRLNYQGSDLPRSLLEFWEGKPITDGEAEKWLAIHGANCYAQKKDGVGLDKSPFPARLAWVKENEENIFALGSSDGSFRKLSPDLEQWWLKADKPWAFLAWAHEWTQYKNNPQPHISHLPVEMDGSSNGYQHIAALLQSKNIAEWVNMLPSETPKDIYTHVANEARGDLERYHVIDKTIAELTENYFALKVVKNNSNKSALTDAEKCILARSMIGELPRSAAKKIIMTYPYSATEFRMAKKLRSEKGIFQRWKDQEVDPDYLAESRKGNRVDSLAAKINYLVPQTLANTICDSINKLFPEVPCLLQWFKQLGKVTSQDRKSISWIAPTGFVIQQDYETKKSKPVPALGLKFSCKFKTGETDTNKHASAIGPNFIHSCDAAHMMRTVNSAWKEGIHSFRMIHDSYATHAADVEKLSRILRQEFIAMYQGVDILKELRTSIIRQCQTNCDIEPAPKIGDLDIDQVMNAKYFFA